MKQVIQNQPNDDDNFDLVDVEALKALRAESLERRQLDKLANEVLPTEDGELEADQLTLREQAKIDRAKLSSPMLEFEEETLPKGVEYFKDTMEVYPATPDGHLYNESLNGEDLED